MAEDFAREDNQGWGNDSRSLRWITLILASVKGKGSVESPEWIDEDDQNLLQSLEGNINEKTIQTVHSVLREKRRRAKLMTRLYETALTVNTRFQAEARRRIFNHGVASIPDAILAHICDLIFVGSSKERVKALEHFQLVCRRFRNVALDNAHLWSFFDDRMTLERIQLQSSRCASVSASFRICRTYTVPPSECMCDRWNALAQLRHRWTSGVIHLSAPRVLPLDHECFMKFGGWKLPCLTKMELAVVEDPSVLSIVSSWEIPQLDHLICDSTAAFSLPLAKPARIFDFSFVERPFWFTTAFAIFAGSIASSITRLSLALDLGAYCHFGDVDEIPVIELKRVEYLTVMSENSGSPYKVATILQKLQMPNLKYIIFRSNTETVTDPAFFYWLRTAVNGSLMNITVTMTNASSETLDEFRARATECLLAGAGQAQVDRCHIEVNSRQKVVLSPLELLSWLRPPRVSPWPVIEDD